MEKGCYRAKRVAHEGMFYDGLVDTADTTRLLPVIDGMVYDLYGVSSSERKQIDNLMKSDKRPG